MLTMLPGRPCSTQRLAAPCIMYQLPLRLVSITAFQPLTLKSIAWAANWPPALLTSTSTPPKRSHTALSMASTCSGSRMVIG
ncbi:hypothetical protein Y695_04064 [Hydrogenophaga sp. T4]|nr:hypothetical protein Y695_04064 [Hydrogenophaga sp. T4]